MAGIFNDEKYKISSEKTIEFIKRQMNVNNYTLHPVLKEDYTDAHTGRVLAAVNIPEDAIVNYPNYICCDQFYDETYVGICSGKHQNLGVAAKKMGVEITTYTDMQYRSNICALHDDGTWHSELYFKETDYYGVNGTVTKKQTYWYRQDVIINEGGSNGIKGFTLKYYDWLDEDGTVIDVDNLPGMVEELFNQEILDVPEGETAPTEEFLYAETYTLRPQLMDDTILDNAVPRYADYTATLYIFADVEYDAFTTDIYYDGVVTLADLPENPIILPDEPVPFIRDAIVQPYTSEGKVIITWITNFTDACTITVNGTSQQVSCEDIVDGYYTFHAVADVPLGGEYSYSIEGKNGVTLTKSFAMPDNMKFLIAGDPQIIAKDSAENWYHVQTILDPLPTLIISMGDQVDAITDGLTRTSQYHMFTEQHSVPIATVRGNHDKNEHFFGHYGLPNADGGNFAFLHKGVLFIAIDTNNTNCQFHIDYITKALAEQEYTWAVLLMHHSLYSASKSGVSDNVNTLREGLTDFIVNQTDICMVLAGHEHHLSRTTYPGKLFFTTPTCTGSKYHVPDNPSAEWNEVVIEQKEPMYTVMDVTTNQITLTTYDYEGTTIDSCSIGR